MNVVSSETPEAQRDSHTRSRLTGDDRWLVPVDNVIFCVDVVCDRLIADLFCSDCDCLFVLLVCLMKLHGGSGRLS